MKSNMSDSLRRDHTREKLFETIVTVFVLAYGIHYLGYFLRARYYNWLDGLPLDEGVAHAFGYLGHTVFLAVMLIYGLAVRRDRPYLTVMFHGTARKNAIFGILGAITGFALMGICVFAASAHKDLAIHPASGVQLPVFLFGLLAVFVQASTEEIESRGFVFGKLKAEGVPLATAAAVSAFFFSYLHAANPGFTLLPLLSIFVIGIQYAICYHYFGTIWFTCAAHAMWNFTQDFIFGLPDSGHPAAISIFNTTVNGSSFFYDEVFGIEGSIMAILVNLLACCVLFLIGRRLQKKG